MLCSICVALSSNGSVFSSLHFASWRPVLDKRRVGSRVSAMANFLPASSSSPLSSSPLSVQLLAHVERAFGSSLADTTTHARGTQQNRIGGESWGGDGGEDDSDRCHQETWRLSAEEPRAEPLSAFASSVDASRRVATRRAQCTSSASSLCSIFRYRFSTSDPSIICGSESRRAPHATPPICRSRPAVSSHLCSG